MKDDIEVNIVEKDANESYVTSKGEENSNEEAERHYHSRKKVITIVVVTVAFVIIGIIVNHINQNKIISISANYISNAAEDTEEGTVLNENNELIKVTGQKKNGEVIELQPGEWTVEEPKTLQKDQTSEIVIHYKNVETSLSVECSTSEVTGILVEYKGDTKEGTEINDDSYFVVTRIHKNGTKDTTDDWHVLTPMTLERDSTKDVEVEAEGFNETVSIICSTISVTKLEVSYTGSIGEGAVLDNTNKGINVKAYYKNGTTKKVTDYLIKEPKTLQRGQKCTVTITYEDVSADLTVEACKAHMMGTTFKEIMDGFNASDFYGMSIKAVRDDGYGIGSDKLRPYTDEKGDKVAYIIDLNSGEDYKAFITFTDYREAAKYTFISEKLDVRTTDPIDGINLRIYDYSKNTYDSEMAAVALKIGEKIASLAGIEFNPTDMVEKGHRQTSNVDEQWQYITYSSNGYDYYFESGQFGKTSYETDYVGYEYKFCFAVDQGIKGLHGYEYDIDYPRQPE